MSEGLKATIHKFDFGSCKAEMNVMYDDRDGQIFVSDDCLDAIKVLVGKAAARSISTASVIVGGRHLNLLNGFKHRADALILDLPLKKEGDVISIAERFRQNVLTKVGSGQ